MELMCDQANTELSEHTLLRLFVTVQEELYCVVLGAKGFGLGHHTIREYRSLVLSIRCLFLGKGEIPRAYPTSKILNPVIPLKATNWHTGQLSLPLFLTLTLHFSRNFKKSQRLNQMLAVVFKSMSPNTPVSTVISPHSVIVATTSAWTHGNRSECKTPPCVSQL